MLASLKREVERCSVTMKVGQNPPGPVTELKPNLQSKVTERGGHKVLGLCDSRIDMGLCTLISLKNQRKRKPLEKGKLIKGRERMSPTLVRKPRVSQRTLKGVAWKGGLFINSGSNQQIMLYGDWRKVWWVWLQVRVSLVRTIVFTPHHWKEQFSLLLLKACLIMWKHD